MQAARKVMLNTGILYVKILVNILIALYTVPVVLKALGASDYGLYNLVAGVITMLAFLNASMTVATQRYMSFFMGSGDISKMNSAFNVSIVLHILISLIIFILFEASSFFLFDGFLNVTPDRVDAAKIVYQFLVISMMLTILSVPFDALMNANENMLAVSIISIFDSIYKLALAISLSRISFDKLVFYSIGTAIITAIDDGCMILYTKYKYREIKINVKKYFERDLFREMFSFAGYNTISGFAMICRNQGIAVVLNLFFGTVINAAYGIANQINGVLSNFSSTLQKSINPQLMKSEGAQNRERMLSISFISSKFSVLILSFFAIPLIIEMPYVIRLWLHVFPDQTIWFSRLVLILSLIYQYSVGLMSAIQSVGKIKQYTIAICIVLLMNIPVACLLLWIGLPAYTVVGGMIFIEIIALSVRLFFSNKIAGLDIQLFIKKVILPTIVTLCISMGISSLTVVFLPSSLIRLAITLLISLIVTLSGAWLYVLSPAEKQVFNNILHSRIKR